ncbi:MAG TPA: methyltransferase domain-containing protein [Steroidobacteraceae bacterium]|jgi:2-polyprenyl-3-methyl-5-hydroxy-6-metoxy-1,4-benzoquinol methylase|nr:methyltransferase domain-containing protein [Steroidobacteraceae bacterium]
MNAPGLTLQQAPAAYWESRAQRFAGEGQGLAAVCSYGMPRFYNHMIQLTQRLALGPWLRVPAGTRVLDLGCGVGRWSRLLAARGAQVTGLDLSPTMLEVARQRTEAAGLAAQCRYLVGDLGDVKTHAALAEHGLFDRVLVVTVLQHVLDPTRLQAAVSAIARRLAPGGRALVLEAAPLRRTRRCDSAIFMARSREEYLQLFSAAGLQVRSVHGVDPAPFKTWLLPHLKRLPRPAALGALAAASIASLPIDMMCGRRAVDASWHALFVLGHAGEN